MRLKDFMSNPLGSIRRLVRRHEKIVAVGLSWTAAGILFVYALIKLLKVF